MEISMFNVFIYDVAGHTIGCAVWETIEEAMAFADGIETANNGHTTLIEEAYTELEDGSIV